MTQSEMGKKKKILKFPWIWFYDFSQDLPVIFHIFQLFKSLATNVAIEKVLVFIFVVISFVNQQIVLFAESSVTVFAIVSFNHSTNLFPTPNMGRWIWMYNEHCFLKPENKKFLLSFFEKKPIIKRFFFFFSFFFFWRNIGFICNQIRILVYPFAIMFTRLLR